MKQAGIIKTLLLPGIIPNIKSIFFGGFTTTAYLIAVIFSAARLLPPSHPYLLSANIGKFSIRHVLAEGANNLTLSKNHIDQVLIYALIMSAVVMTLLQVILFGASILTSTALAQSIELSSLFSNPNARHDIAFIFLDKVFGVADIFKSCVSTGVNCTDVNGLEIEQTAEFPYPIHHALHALFSFYSHGILVIGFIVILYFVTTIIGETAVTGTPFGQRFNKTWGVVRLFLFFTLLFPLASGINLAQYITLHAAKYGSNFATNGWIYFNDSLNDAYSKGTQNTLIAKPRTPELNNLIQFLYIAQTCREAELRTYISKDEAIAATDHQPYIVFNPAKNNDTGRKALLDTSYKQAVELSEKGVLTIHFGHFKDVKLDKDGKPVKVEYKHDFSRYKGRVKPSCGILKIETNQNDNELALKIQKKYFSFIKEMYIADELRVLADCKIADHASKFTVKNIPNCTVPEIANRKSLFYSFVQSKNKELYDIITEAIDTDQLTENLSLPENLRQKGWAAGAIWYNEIANINGAITSSIFNIPEAHKFPMVMEAIVKQRSKKEREISENTLFSPEIFNEFVPNLEDEKDITVLRILNDAYTEAEDGLDKIRPIKSGNVFIDSFTYILGIGGIYQFQNDPDVNPLAQLSSLGKAMIEATVRNLTFAIAARAGSIFIKGGFGDMAKTFSGLIFSTYVVGLLIGFILFYIVPMMPFIYFFFAMLGWVKSIFEAMAAMPLWALSHIARMDGEGIAGPGAKAGYFLILEIFLRPILIIVGLIGAITVLTALVTSLNDLFFTHIIEYLGSHEIPENTGYMDMSLYRQPLDNFMFHVVYVVLIYLIVGNCAKLINMIPDRILRWIGETATTFQENAGDPVSELTQDTYKTGSIVLNNLGNSGKGLSTAEIAMAFQ